MVLRQNLPDGPQPVPHPQPPAPPPLPRQCGTCRYRLGEHCIRYPQWVLVHADHLCGEYRPR